jgi:hypothetical protein
MSNAQTTFQKAYGSGDGAFNNKYNHAGAIYQTADGVYILNARIEDRFISEKVIKFIS